MMPKETTEIRITVGMLHSSRLMIRFHTLCQVLSRFTALREAIVSLNAGADCAQQRVYINTLYFLGSMA